MKSNSRVLLVGSLFFLVSCTLTKRIYTSGYSVEWNNKKSGAKLVSQFPNTQSTQNKNLFKNSSREKATGISKTIGIVNQSNMIINNRSHLNELIQRTCYKVGVRAPKLSKNNLIQNDTTLGNKTSENSSIKKDVTVSWLLCLLGNLGGIILSILVILINYGSTLPTPLGLVPLLAIILLIISLVHSFRALKGEHNWGLWITIVLDIIGILVFLLVGFLLLTALSI